jgi:hypothetical protein
MKLYLRNLAIAVDQLLGALVGIPDADLTISAWVGYRYPGSWMEKAIDAAFIDPCHCQESIEWDVINRLKKQGRL